jgi:hypothetical protein
VRIAATGLTIPPTPPPDIDIEAWRESIERIRAWHPERLAITHFDVYDDVERQLDEVSAGLEAWGERARDLSLEDFIATRRAAVGAGAEADLGPAYVQAAPPEQLYAGLERYWRKRSDRSQRS